MSLLGTMGSGVSALRTYEKGLEVIGNNIANVNTIGLRAGALSTRRASAKSCRHRRRLRATAPRPPQSKWARVSR